MKRYFCFFLCFILLVCGLSGCGLQKSMTVQPAALSAETAQILEPFQNELLIFDVKPTEPIRSYTLNLWRYQDGEWQSSGASYGGIEFFKDRILLKLTDDAFAQYSLSKDGYVGSTFDFAGDEFADCKAIAFDKLSESVAIEPEKKIVLMVKLGTDQSSIRTDFTDDFRTADCTAGVAVTLIFSEKEPE